MRERNAAPYSSLCLLIATLIIAYLLLNWLVIATGVLQGVSIGEYLKDEYRIRFVGKETLKVPCLLNSTHYEPSCSASYYGFQVPLPKTSIEINSFGIRDREYSLEKKNGTYRIFALGDSFTFGLGVNNGEAFPDLIEEELNALYQTRFEVFNLGHLTTGTDAYVRKLFDFWEYSPDLLLLQTNENDVWECKGRSEGIPIPENLENLSLSIEAAADGSFSTSAASEVCDCYLLNVALIAELAHKENLPLVIYDSGPTGCDLSSIEESFYHIPRTTLERKYVLSRGDPHPNQEGHRHLAGHIFPYVITAINETSPAILK